MAKIKKRRLKWSASDSAQVVGYKLYWSEGSEVSYDSKCVSLGNITEVVLPDDVDLFVPDGGPVVFGITALDEVGNESDMTTLVAPYQFNVPKAPDDLYLQKLDDFGITANQDENVDYYLTSLQDDESDEVAPIRLIDAVESIRRGRNGRSDADSETVERKKRVGGKG
ncbi:MAG: hypothetical protein PVI00_09230 [Desulfobacterales bacterium]|jgi:hypothetical protein